MSKMDKIKELQAQLDSLRNSVQEKAEPVQQSLQELKETAQQDIFNESVKERRKNFLNIGIGLIFGAAFTLVVIYYLEEIIDYGKYLDDVFAIAALVVGILLLALLLFKNTLLFKALKVAKASQEAIFVTISDPLKNLVKGIIPANKYTKSMHTNVNAIDQGIRQLIAYMAYTRTRNWLFGLFFTLILGLFGFLGTYLLVKQNELIKEQSYLAEASRRSSLVFMMSNIMDKVDEELRREGVSDEPYHESRKLSDVTIGRIAALSQGMKPINYLEDGELTEKAYSPERGQLLLNLISIKLDTSELYKNIFDRIIFDRAELKNALVRNSYISKGSLKYADLRGTDLSHSNLDNTQFEGANLDSINLNIVTIQNTDFSDCSMHGISLSGADGAKCNFAGASLVGCYIYDSVLRNSYFGFTDNNVDKYNMKFHRARKKKVIDDIINSAPKSIELKKRVAIAKRFVNPANLSKTKFEEVFLDGSNFYGVNTRAAIFKRSSLNDVKFIESV